MCHRKGFLCDSWKWMKRYQFLWFYWMNYEVIRIYSMLFVLRYELENAQKSERRFFHGALLNSMLNRMTINKLVVYEICKALDSWLLSDFTISQEAWHLFQVLKKIKGKKVTHLTNQFFLFTNNTYCERIQYVRSNKDFQQIFDKILALR